MLWIRELNIAIHSSRMSDLRPVLLFRLTAKL